MIRNWFERMSSHIYIEIRVKLN